MDMFAALNSLLRKPPKGEVTAKAIVDDILRTIEHYFVVAKPLQQMAEGKTPPDEYYLRYGQLDQIGRMIRRLVQRLEERLATKAVAENKTFHFFIR